MSRYIVALKLGVLASLYAGTSLADTWIQIEAQPSLTTGTEAASDYAARLQNVTGFKLAGNWHVIALGPYATDEVAGADLRALLAQGRVPSDSFLTDGTEYERPFWPIGVAAIPRAASVPLTTPVVVESGLTPTATPDMRDETPAQARQSEALLDRADRELLQTALKFEGFYTSAIDGAFGRGTRAAMGAWQDANGYEATGILTTAQRNVAIGRYQSVIDSLGLTRVSDDVTGVSIDLPLGLVDFAAYTPPFAKYNAKDNSGVQVLLISQTGDAATLGGLYEIMQTLEIVPMDGPRSRNSDRFTLEGSNSNIVSYTQAQLVAGEVKGFTLIWPTGDAQRREMALDAMRASFTATDGVLPDAYGAGTAQDINLMAGLKIRRADKAGSGFFVDERGYVLTTTSVVDSCSEITLDETYRAKLVAAADGLALLRPTDPLAPLAYATFDSRLPRLQSEVSVSGYAYEGRLGAASLNYGILAEHKGLDGENGILRLTMTTLPGEVGGPVLAASGGVIGMLAPQPTDTRTLPDDVAFAYDVEKLATFLSDNGISVWAADAGRELSDAALVDLGRDITTLVSCWN